LSLALSQPSGVGDHLGVAGRIYSVGYEGLSLDALVDRLAGSRVTTVVDVRLNPISRRPGFSRKRLEAALNAAGIDYVHEKALGNPPENRDSFRSGDGADGRKRMREILANGARDALQRIVELASDGRIALLCVEREPHRCHRDVITDAAVEKNPAIEVIPMW
jgi:uncharacterized protein (DUF488 family)